MKVYYDYFNDSMIIHDKKVATGVFIVDNMPSCHN